MPKTKDTCFICNKPIVESKRSMAVRNTKELNYVTICNECSYRTGHVANCHYCSDYTIIYKEHITREGYFVCYKCHAYYKIKNNTSVILSHSSKPLPIFHGKGSQLGIELEIDKIPNMINIKNDLFPLLNNNIYLKHDGSLRKGFELVSDPGDIYWHLQTVKWDKIFEACQKNKAISHSASTCGLHIHIDKKAFGNTKLQQDLNILKLLYIFEKFQPKIRKFSRRTKLQIRRWCSYIPISNYNKYKPTSANSQQRDSGRYLAVNLTPNNTVEIRIFRGTLNLNTFYATLQFTDNLIQYINTVGIAKIATVSWDDFIKNLIKIHPYGTLIQYLTRKRLYNPPEYVKAKILKKKVKNYEGD